MLHYVEHQIGVCFPFLDGLFDMLLELTQCSILFPVETTLSYIKYYWLPACISQGHSKWRVSLFSVPLVEDRVHSLGQVIHGAVGRHRWVLLVAGPEGGDAKARSL